jgi:Ni/Co efflux regulator RcnB
LGEIAAASPAAMNRSQEDYMYRLFIPTVILTLVAGSPALADTPNPGQNNQVQVHRQQQQKPQAVQPQRESQGSRGNAVTATRPTAYPVRRDANTVVRRDTKTVLRTQRYAGPRDYVPGHRPANWNNRPRAYDPRHYHHNYVAVHRYHWRLYVRPHGWYYRRWVYGEHFPDIFWARDYWITDYWLFGLAIPPYGCEWVRYGNDAVLINIETGEILQVIYGIYY